MPATTINISCFQIDIAWISSKACLTNIPSSTFSYIGRAFTQPRTMKRSPSSDCSEHEAEIPSRPARPLPSLTTLSAPVSPPRKRASIRQPAPGEPEIVVPGIPRTEKLPTSPERRRSRTAPTPAATDSGKDGASEVTLAVSEKLSECIRPKSTTPRISLSDWVDLYSRNEHPEGRHFVVHQHDHPLSGPHYDLRLQFSQTSSVCWSIMYGLPGDPNSIKINRNAAETRIHSLNVSLMPTCLFLGAKFTDMD